MKYDEKLEQVIRTCLKKMDNFSETVVLTVVQKFENVLPKVTMKVLTQKLLEVYKEPTNPEFKLLINEIFKLNDGSYSNPQDIVDEINLEKKQELEKNHKIVNESIQEVCNKFNELGIDYYIVGALPVYLQAGEMQRKHEDIDFMVAEKDLPLVAKALSTTIYKFEDNRLDSPRVLDENGNLTCGDHEVVASRDDDKFHLGFFLFKREKDGSVTQREYHARLDENGNKIPVLATRQFSKELFEYNYGGKPVKYLNTQFKASTPESVYDIKSFMLEEGYREKDDFDVKAWRIAKNATTGEDLIDENKLKEMRKISDEHSMQYIPSKDVSQALIEEIRQQQKEIKGYRPKVKEGGFGV